jgi:hypothetical protein
LIDLDQEIGIGLFLTCLRVLEIGLDKEGNLAFFTDGHPESKLGLLVGFEVVQDFICLLEDQLLGFDFFALSIPHLKSDHLKLLHQVMRKHLKSLLLGMPEHALDQLFLN